MQFEKEEAVTKSLNAVATFEVHLSDLVKMSVLRSEGWLDPFSYIGGLFVALYLVGNFLTDQYTQLRLNCDLIQSLFISNTARETKISDRLSSIIEQRSTFKSKDVLEFWDRYLSHRKKITLQLCRVLCCSCGGRNRDSFLYRNG